MDIIELKAQEYGMKVFEAVEYNAPKYCITTLKLKENQEVQSTVR
jgi:hypothetical protein